MLIDTWHIKRITDYKGTQRIRVNGWSFGDGMQSNLKFLEETENYILAQSQGTTSWSGIGSTSYYEPRLYVFEKVHDVSADWSDWEEVRVVFDKTYSRETRKATFEEARKIMIPGTH